MGLRHSWPLPAVLAWAGCWAIYQAGIALALAPALALVLAMTAGLLFSLGASGWWRRLIIAAGFPLSVLATGAPVSGWVWLVLLTLVLLLYPFKAWRDAPLFPTPAGALRELAARAALPADAQVLDAGCGLGDGLIALRAAYPAAQLHGLEWSWPLRALCALRCPWARVRHGDLWRTDWRPYAMVYLFQRPESMARAVTKAATDMADGAWLVSLEFEAASLLADDRLELPDGRIVWLYRLPFTPAPQVARCADDMGFADMRQSS